MVGELRRDDPLRASSSWMWSNRGRSEIGWITANRSSFKAGDEFQVTVKVARRDEPTSSVRLVFEQSILHEMDAPPILEARIICTAVNAAGRPYFPEQLADLIDS